jgi:hypothetical protein
MRSTDLDRSLAVQYYRNVNFYGRTDFKHRIELAGVNHFHWHCGWYEKEKLQKDEFCGGKSSLILITRL